MKILGIDPGTATTGWGVLRVGEPQSRKRSNGLSLVNFGCIITDSEREMQHRLLYIKEELKRIIKDYQPAVAVVEQIFFGVNSRTAIAVGQARGAILLAAAETSIPVFEYTGLTVKLTVADHGRADKNQVQEAVRRHLQVKSLPVPKNQAGKEIYRFRDDAYDALAIALCYYLKGRANA